MTEEQLNENELLFNELYEKTKDCGRVQFINLLMAKEREVKELKKQLEKIKNEPLTNRIGRIDSVIANIYSRNRTHQKEFIEYLENYIDALNQQKETVEGLDIGEEHILMVLEEVLEKYKVIIGGSNENNSI